MIQVRDAAPEDAVAIADLLGEAIPRRQRRSQRVSAPSPRCRAECWSRRIPGR
jgi:hypothetical protein